MKRIPRRTREQNLILFNAIVEHIINDKEFQYGGITSAEKHFMEEPGDLNLGLSNQEIVDLEVKLYKAWKQFIKKEA